MKKLLKERTKMEKEDLKMSLKNLSIALDDHLYKCQKEITRIHEKIHAGDFAEALKTIGLMKKLSRDLAKMPQIDVIRLAFIEVTKK